MQLQENYIIMSIRIRRDNRNAATGIKEAMVASVHSAGCDQHCDPLYPWRML